MPVRRKAPGSGGAPARDTPPQLDLGAGGLTLDALLARISELEALLATQLPELADLRFRRRNRLGGHATAGRPRRRKVEPDLIWLTYLDEIVVRNHGAVGRTARVLGICRKTVSRAIRDRKSGKVDPRTRNLNQYRR